eukprot:PhM_4_TR7903/c0_g1_i1/m.45125/K21767/TBCD; tubulin-specific chaperone D
MTATAADEDPVSSLTYFVEFEEVSALITNMSTSPETIPASVQRIWIVLEKYQEAPHLIKPKLHDLVDPVVAMLRNCLTDTSVIPPIAARGQASYALGDEYSQFDVDAERTNRHDVARVLYCISKVVGYKTLVPFFPHDVRCVTSVTATLANWYMDPKQMHEWEVAYVLLLWLCNVVLVPFALDSFDDELCPKLIQLSKLLLAETSRARDGAAFLVAKLFSRPDTAKQCGAFVNWAVGILQAPEPQPTLCTGIMMALAQLLKIAKRQELLQYVELLEPAILDSEGANDASVFRYKVKATQRLGVLYVPPNAAVWRYQKKRQTLLKGAVKAERTSSPQDDEWDVPEAMESVLDIILRALRHPDTVVRWSAAKGIGRLCSRLPYTAATEVQEALKDLFSVKEDDAAWHGGCLALAELVRRGLILPSSFPSFMPFLIEALQYDTMRGSHSVGAHVRDAGCYVAWSLARAYDPDVLSDYVNGLSSALLFAASYDREVNVRRAAAAAFQECVGRLGCFPYGIDIVTTADYFSLSLRKNAFLSVGPTLAQYDPYGSYFLQRLCNVTIRHWDKDMRQLASQSIALIVKDRAEEFVQTQFARIVKLCLDASVDVRTGALLTLAETLTTLPRDKINAEMEKDIIMVLPMLESGRLFRGRGGEHVRVAACCLVSSIASVGLPLPEVLHLQRAVSTIGAGKAVKQNALAYYQTILEECIKQPLEHVQEAAVRALTVFFRRYYDLVGASTEGSSTAHVEASIPNMLSMIAPSRSPNERRGFVLALGALPLAVLSKAEHRRDIIAGLAAAVELETDKDAQDAETRKNAVLALADITIRVVEGGRGAPLMLEELESVRTHILKGLEDYALDKRGDVGSMVRMAAVTAAIRYLGLVLSRDTDALAESSIRVVLRGVMKQLVEKIDRVRGHTGAVVHSFVRRLDEIATTESAQRVVAPYRSLLQLFHDSEVDWSAPATLNLVVPELLSRDEFVEATLEGLVVSIGGLSIHVTKEARGALMGYIRGDSAAAADDDRPLRIGTALLEIIKSRSGCDRVVLPAFATCDNLLTGHLYPNELHDGLSVRLDAELMTCVREIHKQLALVDVLCTMCASPVETARVRCLRQALRLVGVPPYPKVRGKVAQQLYTAVLSSPTPVPDAVGEILMGTCWEDMGKMDVVTAAQDRLIELFGVEKLVVDLGRAKKAATGVVDKASYAGLVREAGY